MEGHIASWFELEAVETADRRQPGARTALKRGVNESKTHEAGAVFHVCLAGGIHFASAHSTKAVTTMFANASGMNRRQPRSIN